VVPVTEGLAALRHLAGKQIVIFQAGAKAELYWVFHRHLGFPARFQLHHGCPLERWVFGGLQRNQVGPLALGDTGCKLHWS